LRVVAAVMASASVIRVCAAAVAGHATTRREKKNLKRRAITPRDAGRRER
jgi:hypothetical protein